MTKFLENRAMGIASFIYSLIPQPSPQNRSFNDLGIIAHRGQYDGPTLLENTLEAFTQARQTPICGIEFDIRWTSDLEPMIFHDADLKRIYGQQRKFSSFTYKEIRNLYPKIPHLSEVIEQFKDLHLMIEIKETTDLDWVQASQKLKLFFDSLSPISGFHLMCLKPELYDHFKYLPPQTFLPIAKTNVSTICDLALKKSWGGVTGHYLLINSKRLEKHKKIDQVVGTGFPDSLNTLYREANRGIDYIFTNHALPLYQAMLKAGHEK